MFDFSQAKIIKGKPPKCKECRHPEVNDPKRIAGIFSNIPEITDEEYDKVFMIMCPSIRCANGWWVEKAEQVVGACWVEEE